MILHVKDQIKTYSYGSDYCIIVRLLALNEALQDPKLYVSGCEKCVLKKPNSLWVDLSNFVQLDFVRFRWTAATRPCWVHQAHFKL